MTLKFTIEEYVVAVSIIKIEGRLDAFSVGDFRQAIENLVEEGKKNFVLDLKTTEFIDSAGMASLVSLLKRARASEGDVILVKPEQEGALRILTLTRFDKVFKMVDDAQAGINSF